MRVYASAEMTLTDTNDGISVTGIDRHYMASSSSSGITVSSQGWQPDPQETNPISRYHWSYEVVNYSSGPPVPTKPAIIGVYGKEGKEGVDAVTVALSSEAHTFAGTESQAIASSITIDVSAFKGNQRISTSIGTVTGGITGQLTHSESGRGTTNNKLVINATSSLDKANGTLSIPIVADGRTFNKVFSWSVAFKGKTGDKGDAGVSITKVDVEYAQNTSETSAPTSGWDTTAPTWKNGLYIWSRTKTTYSIGNPTYSKPACITGQKGSSGSNGNHGRGISSIVEEYYLSNSKETRTGDEWKETAPTWSTGKYMWTRSKIVWVNPSDTTYTDPIVDTAWEAVNEIEIGGRNLAHKGLLEGFSLGYTRSGDVFTMSGGSAGIRIMPDAFEPNTSYVMSFKFRKLSGTVNNMAGHSSGFGIRKVLIDGINTGTSWAGGGSNPVPNDTGVHTVEVHLYLTDNSQIGVYIQPNRATYTDAYTLELWDLKLEKGNKATDWTPAPEDVATSVKAAQDKANDASQKAIAAQEDATVGKNMADNLSNDSIITQVEKLELKREWDAIVKEKPSITIQATDYALQGSTEATAYNTAYNSLNGSIPTLLSKMNETSPINRTTFNTNFANYYDKRQLLLNRIAKKAKELADVAQSSVDNLEIGGENLFAITNTVDGYESSGNIRTSTEVHRTINNLVDIGDTKSLIYQVWNPNRITNTSNVNRVAFFTEANVHISSVAMPQLNGSTYQMLKIEVPTNARKARLGAIMGIGTIDPLIKIKFEKGDKATDWSSAPEDVEAAYKKYAVDQILADKTIKDTRHDNQTPAWYFTNYKRQTIKEFKLTSTIGVVSSEGSYGILETEIPWSDASGGPVKQTFRVNSKTFKRSGTTASWSSWVSYDDIAETAKGIAEGAASSASTANSLLTDIASDSVLTPGEKKSTKKEWDIIVGEKPKIDASADTYSITTQKTAYANAYNALNTYLTGSSGLLVNLNIKSAIVGTTFRNNFKNYYNARQDLLNAIANGAKSLVDEIEIGGRNYFTKETQIHVKIPGSGFVVRGPETPNGFKITGRNGGDTSLRINNVITSNGWWTVSFDIRGTQTTYVSVSVDINDKGSTVVRTNNTNTYERKSVSVYVDNYSETVHNFVDFDNFGWAYYLIDNIKVEKGNKATDWSPAPEDVQSGIDNKAESEALNGLVQTVTTETERLNSLSTDVESTNNNFLITHTDEYVNKITTTESTVEGLESRVVSVEETKENVDTFFQFDDAFTIGKSNAQTKLRMTNDEIQFLDGETKGTYITGNTMVSQNMQIQDKLNLPKHTFETEGDITVVKYIG